MLKKPALKAGFPRALRVIGLVAVLVILGSFTYLSQAAPAAEPPLQGVPSQGIMIAPYQKALVEAVAARQAAGLPVPSVTVDQGADQERAFLAQGVDIKMVTTTTIITYDGPEQAGYTEWPAVIVKDGLPAEANGTVRVGDYTETYRAVMEQQFPGIWERYEFGHEPRQQTVIETMTYREVGAPPTFAPGDPTTEALLMGFTYTGPHLDYTISSSLGSCWEVWFVEICTPGYTFKAGFELDWGVGLRLPAEATLSGPAEMAQGSVYQFESVLNPLDWDGDQYDSAGVAAEDGNEFVLYLTFFVGVQGKILTPWGSHIDICSSCYVEVEVDQSTSFTTPFGSGADFPIPAAFIPVKEWDFALFYFAAGMGVQPHLGSSKITADWTTIPDSGHGQVTYTQPGVPVYFGPVQTCALEPGDELQVELSNYRYWFNQFLIELTAGWQFKLFNTWEWNQNYTIANFDLSRLTSGLYLGKHLQCDALFHCGPAGPDNQLAVTSLITQGDATWQVTAAQPVVSVQEGDVAVNQITVKGGCGSVPPALAASLGTVTPAGGSAGNWLYDWSYPTIDGPAETQTVVLSAEGGQGTFDLIVGNVPPTGMFAAAPNPVEEGESADLTFADMVDPSPVDFSEGFKFAFDCGNGQQSGNIADPGYTCTYPVCGDFQAQASIMDKDGGLTLYGTVVTVTCAPPPILITPTTYGLCPVDGASDTITVTNVRNRQLRGQVIVDYVLETGRQQVMLYPVNHSGPDDFVLTVAYPPIAEWPYWSPDPATNSIKEIHVDVQIEVLDAQGNPIRNADGSVLTLGPGQDWDVFCHWPVTPDQ